MSLVGDKVILVTGAAGFVGNQVVLDLVSSGNSVLGFDNLNDAYDVQLKEYRLSRLESLPVDQFRFVKGDLEDYGLLSSLFEEEKIGAVINLAARAGVRYSVQNPVAYCRTNTIGTINILEAMRYHGVRKLVQASTSSLYAGQPIPFREDMPVNEPISPYAASKKAAEMHAHAHHHLFDIDVSIVRFFTVYGPAGRPDMSIFRFVKWIDEGTPIQIYGDGNQSRDFTYITDISAGTISALKEVGFEVFNIGGGGTPVSLLSVIRILEENLGKKAEIDFQAQADADIYETKADVEKAREFLGWTSKVSLEEGLSNCCYWYQENRSWLQHVSI